MIKRLPPFAAIGLIGVALMLVLPAAASAATPDVATLDSYSTDATTATVEGLVNPNAESTTYGAQYDVESSAWCQNGTGSPAHTTNGTDSIPTDNSLHFVTVDLTGLTEGTGYCAQLTATNSDGDGAGGQVTWTQGAPTAETFDAGYTGNSTATVDGDVNPAGKTTTYEVWYDVAGSEWCATNGQSGSPNNGTAAVGLGFTDSTFHDVSVDLTGLSTNTNYCAEIVATNADGINEGGQLSWSQPSAPPPNKLTVSIVGSGRVTSSPAGIDCGAGDFSGLACSYGFAPGTEVTLTATPGAGSGPIAWTGCTSIGPSSLLICHVTLNSDATVKATFASAPRTPKSPVTVQLAGNGSSTVTSNPAGIDCGSTCTQQFPITQSVTLSATRAPGSTFAGWSYASCFGTGPCAVQPLLVGSVTITATFNQVLAVPSCKVPKVKGKTFAAAKTAIRKAHCTVGKITKAFSAKVKKGRVLSQKPAPGSKHPAGTRVRLTVSKGPKPS